MAATKKILILAEKAFSKDAVAQIQRLGDKYKAEGYELVFVQGYKNREADVFPLISAANNGIVGIVVRSDKVDAEFLSHVTADLKIVVRAGAGYDNVDLAVCKSKGIAVMNTPGQNSNAVAELAIAQAITALRKNFTGKGGSELRGRKLGLHGFGAVARNVARIGALGFEMEVFAYDPYYTQANLQKDCPTLANVVRFVANPKELYSTCDVVSIHTPLTDETRGSVGAELLAMMPPTSVLVNTARAEVVVEDAIKEKLANCPAFVYAADVAPKCAQELQEKYPERVTFSKIKCGAQTEEANTNCGTAAVNQIVGFIERGDNTFQVNK